MGTNYYHRHNQCDCCGRYEQRHIGKSLTMFQGYKDASGDQDIASWSDWKQTLTTGGTVIDEYGTAHPTERFINEVEATSLTERSRQFRWVQQHMPKSVQSGNDWLDADGFSFTLAEFE